MKPPKFEYHAPTSLDEALAALGRYGGDAKVLAGGQSLMPLLNFRLARPAALVDLNRIASLAYIREQNGQVRLGAMTRQRTIEFSPVVAQRLPLLKEATRWVGHLPIRTRGTIGGSIAHADPSAEYPAVLAALEGEVVARGAKGERVIRAADLFQTYLTTNLAPDEILTEVRLPAMPAGAGYALEEFRAPTRRLCDRRDRGGGRARGPALQDGAAGDGGSGAGARQAARRRGDSRARRARRGGDRSRGAEGHRAREPRRRHPRLGRLSPPPRWSAHEARPHEGDRSRAWLTW
jgi:hypothetical protein